jgi:hypothetical protein
MANLTNFGETAFNDWAFRPGATSPTRPTSMKVVLLTAITDAEAGTVTAASYAGYTDQDAGFGADAGGAGVIANAAQINFAAVAGGPITVVGHALKDHLGNLWAVKALASSVTYQTGDIPFIAAGALTHTTA